MAMDDALTLSPAAPRDEARSLRSVLDLLLYDMAVDPIDPATVPWDRPILVLRSANMDRMRAFLEQLVARCPTPALHIMSHARDEETIRAMAPCAFTFHAYPTPGRYRLAEVPAPMLDRLRSTDFGVLFFLDSETSSAFAAEVERLLSAIVENRMVSVREDGTWARAFDWRLRRRAEPAFLRLVEWYQLKLDPNSHGGVVLPSG